MSSSVEKTNLTQAPASAETSQEQSLGGAPAQVVSQYFYYLQSGNLVGLGELLDADILWHQPGQGELSGTYRGSEAVFQLFSEVMSRSQGSFKIDEVSGLMVNGPWVSAPIHFSASSGTKSMKMRGVDFMRVEHGKIKEVYLFSENQEAEDEFWKS